MQAAAQDASAKLKDAVAKGTDFKTAATTLGLKVDTLPVFVPAKAQQAAPQVQSIAMATVGLNVGQVSDPVPSQNAVLVLHVDARTPADPAGLAQFETRYRESQDEQLRRQAYADWADWKSKQPGTHKPPQLDAYGSVE
jgi:parvulin-like peptidyl-prolyl isomerase